MPNSNFGNIQYKASNGLIKLDELEGIVECFVSGIGNKDSVGDICATGAFAKSLQRRKPRVVWGHNWNDPIGKVLEIYEVPASDPRLPMKMKMAGIGGLYAKVQFNLQSEKGKEAFANVAFFGEEQEWSIGYKTLRAQYDDNLQANVLYEVELYEVSPVLHGANQLTGTISVKSDEEKMHGMMPIVIGGPGSNAPSRENIFEEGVAQRISGSQLASVVAELSRRAGGPVMVVEATENSVVFVKPGKGKFRIGYHFTGSEYMFGKPELIHADQPKPQMQSGPSPVPGISAKPTAGQKPTTMNPAMPMPVAVKPGNGGMIMVPLPQVEYEGMDKDKKPELVAEERELAESLVRIAGKYGKFDEDGDGIWAGYYPPAENKVKDIGVKCSNCVLYQGEGKCKILDLKVEDEGKCRFAIIPDGVVVGYGKKEYNDILDDEEIKMVEDIEAKYPGEFILGTLRNTVKKRRKKRRSYKTLEEWGVEEQELIEKGLDPFLAQDLSYVIPVDPTDAFEFKSMIDPVLEYHRIDTYVNEYGVVIASQLDQEAKDALETATKAAARRLGRSIRSAGGGGSFLGRTLRGGRGLGVPSGDLDPRTRRDSNTNGILFDKIPGWEQPDPTPNGPGSINNPKPSKRQLTDAAKPDGKEKLSSGKRNMRRHADRSADMEKQFPNAEENQKRADHEAIAKAWEDQGLGWEEVPRYNADKNFSSDYLRGREIGVNQARVMWQGDSVRKRPEKFNEKQKASQEYSNWYSSFAKSVSAYLDAHSRDDSDNWDGIESALRADVRAKYPDTQDWAKEDIATLNEYLNDIGLLDVDKLKKKKKKGGAETEKGPDLQELRKLNAEGKLSSGKASRRDLVSGKKVPGEGKFARLIDEQMGNRNDEREPSYVARKYADALVENWRGLSDSERKEFLQDEMGSEYMPKAEEFLEILDEAWATYSQRNKKFKDIDNELQDIMDSSRLSSGGRLGAAPDDAEYGRELAAQRARDRAAGRNATNPIGRGGDAGDGERLSSGMAEWTETEDGLEMDAPDIDGAYQIQGSNKEGFVVTRYSDAFRNGGQDGQEYEHNRVFKTRAAAKKWAEKDYDKIIENMVRDEEYMQDSSRLSSGYTNSQFSREDLGKILDRFRQTPEFQEWMEVQDELESRMRRFDSPRSRYPELDKEETRLDGIAMAARQQVIEELLAEGDISLRDVATPKPSSPFGIGRDGGRLSSGAIPDSARQKRLIEAAEAASARKPDGTESFAASVARQYRKNGKLSEKQWATLDRMFGGAKPGGAPKTSPSRTTLAPFSGKRRKIIDLADVPEYDYPNAPGGRKPTEEQSNAIDAMMTGDDVKISALAATGKTTTVINFAERLRDTEPEARALYLVFNTNARDDAEKRGMPDNVRVMTMDAISFRAMRTVNPEMTKKSYARETGHIKPIHTFAQRAEYLGTRGTVEQGKELTPVDVYKRVAKAVDAFSVSDDTEFGPQHFNGAYNGGLKVEDPEVIAELLPFAKKMWEDMNTPRVAPKGGDRGKGMLPMNNTNLTKMWALTNPDIGDNEGINVTMVDEAQDMNPVFAGILRNSNSIQRIYIGDPNQAINAWRGADGKTLENAYAKYNMPITDSFRFGKNIADRGNRFLNLLGRQERMNGRKTDKSGRPVDGRIGSISNPTMILTRSNGGGIAATLDSFEKGRTVYGSKNFKDDLATFIDNIEYMTNAATGKGYFTDGDGKQVFGKPKESQDLDGISTLEEFNKAIEKKDNNRLNMLGKILDKYSIEELRDALDRVITDKAKLPKDRDAYVHIQTAHTSKGLESPRVLIWSDFRKPKKDTQGNWVLPDEQELRLSYVAVTRAEEELDLGSLGWIEQFESDVDPSSVRFSSGRNEFSPVAINAVSVEDDNSWMDRSAVGRGTTTASGGKWNGAKPARSDIKPGADLSGADLRRMVLSGANLANANMEGADLTGADLTNARLIGVNLTGANLTNWQIGGADIFRAKLPKNWNGGNGAGSRMLPEGRLSSGMREFDELTDLEKQEVARNLEDVVDVPDDAWDPDGTASYPWRKFQKEYGDSDSTVEDYRDFIKEAARNGDWETLEEYDQDLSSRLRGNPEAHPDYEMMLELDKDDREWADMMSEMRSNLSSDGSSEDEVERILDHWLYSSDSPKQEEYLAEYREPGDNYNDTFTRAAKAMYQDHLERLYDNRQDRNLSSGRRSPEQESRISDREVFERRMAGESLAETAKALGMKREEVRQAEMRHMARERGTLQTPDFDEIETYREDQARIAAEEAAELALNESIYTRRMGGETLAETAEALGMSREEVRTREQKHMQLMRSMDREAKNWLDRDGTFSSGRRDYVSPLDDMEVGQRLSSGKLDEVYRSVQDKLIEQIEKIQETGDGKWEFPWHKTSLPKNVTNNNRPYSGINSVMLMFKQDAMGYEMPLWAGFNQWKNLGGTVRKGEKGTLILIPTILPKKKDADGNEIRGSGGVFFKTGHVFNIDQIDGIDKEQFRVPELPEEERVAELEQALSEVGAVVNTGGDRAFYRPSTDEIHLPPFSAFKSKEGYYAVFAHELMHWTGHPSRLNRDHLGEFGSPEYAQEELVAEIASAFFMAAHGLTPEPREDHAQYLASWLKKLKSDPDAMKKAFGEAQKAHEYAISKSPSMSAKLGKKVAESGVLPGNGDAGYGDIGPSLSSGRVGKYVSNPEGTIRTLADEMGAFGDELLTRFQMVRGSRDGDRHYFEDYADLGESRSVLGERRSPNEWSITQGEDGTWSATLLRLEFGNGYTERDWAGVVSDEYDSPEDVAKWINDYENTRKAWTEKFRAETDFEKIASMLEEETARRDAEYEDSIRLSGERLDRQQYNRMMSQIDASRLEWSAEDWADEAADIEMELARENSRLSSGVRSRHDETPVEEIGTVSNALKRTDEAGSNSRYIASRLAPVPADKYDFNSIRKNGESVSFTYGGKPRTIYPTGMMAKKGGGIYIVGLDDDAGQYRSYSLHKIEGLIDGADAPYNPTQPGVPRGVPGSSAQRTRNITSGRLSSGRVRPLDEVRAEIEDDARYESMVVQDAFNGRLGTEKKGEFRVTIPLEDHAEAVQSLDRLVALRNDLLRSLLDGKRMPAGSYIFDVDKYAPVAEDELDLLMNIDDAVDRIHGELTRREELFSELNDEIEDMKGSISELEDAFRTTSRMGARNIPGPVDFESAMERNIDMADGDDEYAIRLIESDADSIIEALEKIDDTEDRFSRVTHEEQIAEIKELIDSADRGDLTPQEFASKLGDLYVKNVNGLEDELSDLFNIQTRFEDNGVTPDREDITGTPKDVFSSSNLSNFDMVEGDAAEFSSGRRKRTQGSKRRPMSDADRQAFADGVRQRAATIPGKKRPGPSKDEFGTDRLSSGRLRFPNSETRNSVGRYLESKVKIKFGKISENNDRSPDGKWMLDAKKLEKILKDENGNPLSMEESAKFLGISEKELEKMFQDGAGISEIDAYEFIDRAFFGGRDPGKSYETLEAIWGFDAAPYWYDKRRGNLLNRAEYEDYKEEGIAMYPLYTPIDFEVEEKFVAREVSKKAFPVSALADSLGVESDEDLAEAITFEVDGEQITPTAIQLKKWKKEGVPTSIIEQLIDRGIIPSAGDVFGEEGFKFDNSIRQFDLWKNVKDAIEKSGAKVKYKDLDEVIGAAKVLRRLKDLEEGKEGKFSKNTGKALRYSDDEVKEIVDRLNKKYKLSETVESIKGGGSMSSGRRAARRISDSGAEAIEKLSSGRENNGAPENITPRMQNEIMRWAQNATWSTFAKSVVAQFRAQGFLSRAQWVRLLQLHDNSQRRR